MKSRLDIDFHLAVYGLKISLRDSRFTIHAAGRESRENLALAYPTAGNAYDSKGDPDLAIADYDKAIQL